MNQSVSFIGGGRITKIFLQAFKNKSVAFRSTDVHEINKEVLSALKKQFADIQTPDLAEMKSNQDIIFIALHPPVIMETLDKIMENVGDNTVVISLAPKISIEKLSDKLKTDKIVRMIPNATSYINEGFNPVCFADGISGDEKRSLLEILNLLGKTLEVEESKLEGYAIISAMLPTYFWFQWQKLEEVGQQIGLTEKESSEAIRDTLLAAVHLFYNSNLSADQVIDLIPVKPVAEHESTIRECLEGKLIPLFDKIKP